MEISIHHCAVQDDFSELNVCAFSHFRITTKTNWDWPSLARACLARRCTAAWGSRATRWWACSQCLIRRARLTRWVSSPAPLYSKILFVTCGVTWQCNVDVAEPDVIVHARNKESVQNKSLKGGKYRLGCLECLCTQPLQDERRSKKGGGVWCCFICIS